MARDLTMRLAHYRWHAARSPAIDRRRLGLGIGAAAGLIICVCCVLPASGEAIAYLLPGLALLAALAARHYPGERALLAIIGKTRRRRKRPRIARLVCRLRPRALVPRGGALLAASLAVRPPPLIETALT